MKKSEDLTELFVGSQDDAAESASALTVYALVPFLGIIFVPFALIFGFVALGRRTEAASLKTARRSLFFASVIFIIQILLWWLLTLVPELRRY